MLYKFLNTIAPEGQTSNAGRLKCTLFIIPVLYLFLLYFFYYQSKSFFSSFPDPVYVYLINGTNLASGNFDIGHFDHPGTPVQWLVAITVFITHLFLDKNPLNQSVLSQPEFYLGVCSIVLAMLLIISVYASGRLVFKHTGNLIVALLFQLIPIGCYTSAYYMIRIMPESFIIISLTYYSAFLWVTCHARNNSPERPLSDTRNLLIFSFFSALLITTKVTCLPFMIIPLFFIEKHSKKFLYVILSFIFAALIIYPVWSKLPQMFEWFTGLATHSGIYGQGKEEVFDKTTFLPNIGRLLSHELFFGIGYVLMTIAVITAWVLKKTKDNFFKLLLAFWMMCTAQLFLVAKHFDYHYLIPAQLLIIPGVLAAVIILIHFKSKKVLGFSFLIVCFAWLFLRSAQFATANQLVNQKMYESALIAKKYAYLPKIITTTFHGSCFVESALRYGSVYGGGSFHASNYFLRKTFPGAYFYDLPQSSDFVKSWDMEVYPVQLFEKTPQLLAYFMDMKETDEMVVIRRLTSGVEAAIKRVDIIDQNTVTGERLYMIEVDTSKTRLRYVEQENMFYDFEQKTIDNSAFISKNGKHTIGEAYQQSGEQYFSGSNSVKMLSNQYSCNTTLAVEPGDAFDITVNSFSSDKPVGIVVSSEGNKLYRGSEAIVEENENGWKKIGLKVIVPKEFTEKEVKIYLYYFGKKTCYVDDLNIVFSKISSSEGSKAP